MLKLAKWALVLSLVIIINACNKEQVECDCSNEVAKALKEAKQNKKKLTRKGKTSEEKKANKLKRQEAKGSGVNLRLEKSKFAELNLSQTQKDVMNQAKTALDESLTEETKQYADIQQLLNDALRTGEIESINQVLIEQESMVQSQRNKELEYKLAVYSQLNLDQLTILADNPRLLKSMLGLKNNSKKNKRNKRGKGNKRKKNKDDNANL